MTEFCPMELSRDMTFQMMHRRKYGFYISFHTFQAKTSGSKVSMLIVYLNKDKESFIQTF